MLVKPQGPETFHQLEDSDVFNLFAATANKIQFGFMRSEPS